ncbi:MAG: MATE family efflux transporter [Rheinheimera sp.]|nr:MATE family efflux transporter [Rheinheimera sp.]
MVPFSRFEAKTILKLSGPIVIAQLTQTMMYVVDTLMAGQVGVVDMAAVAVGSALWLPILLTFQGLLLALTPNHCPTFWFRPTQSYCQRFIPRRVISAGLKCTNFYRHAVHPHSI